jgi:hypothetical protein
MLSPADMYITWDVLSSAAAVALVGASCSPLKSPDEEPFQGDAGSDQLAPDRSETSMDGSLDVTLDSSRDVVAERSDASGDAPLDQNEARRDVEVGGPLRYELRIVVTGADGASGSVVGKSSPGQANIDCGSRCAIGYEPGTMIKLAAWPAAGSFFEGFEDVDLASDATSDLMMDRPRVVTAKFTKRANVVFWTSSTFGFADLAAKGAARDGGSMGARVLAGADVACEEAARAPGSLVPPGKYVAWMSTSEDSALDRVKRAHGGQTPRGWVRVDGRPFMDKLSPIVLYPSRLDERGEAGSWFGFTGTSTDGTPTDLNCSNWTDTSTNSFGIVGQSFAGGGAWTAGNAYSCELSGSVLCMQADYTSIVVTPFAAPPAKRAFVAYVFDTSTGLDGADARCREDAAANQFMGTFRALLPPAGASAASRFHPAGTLGYVRTDGVLVSEKDTDLLSASPVMLAPISLTAYRDYTFGEVVTGAESPAALSDGDCRGWTVAATDQVRVGGASGIGRNFFDAGYKVECSHNLSIYCLED